MGGEIGAEPREPSGSVFWFTVSLPASSSATPEVEALPLEQPLTPTTRILVVDDIDTNRELVAAYLKSEGVEPDLASSGREAVELVRTRPYDLVFMDLNMPEMDGLEATRTIRGLSPPASEVAIVALTAGATTDDIDVCRRAGMHGHVAKPVEKRELIAAVRQHAGRRVLAEVMAETSRTIGDRVILDPDPLDSLREQIGSERFAKLYAMMMRDLDAAAQELAGQDRDLRIDKLRATAHRLISTSGHLGAMRLNTAAEDLSRRARAHRDNDELDALRKAIAAAGDLATESLAALSARYGLPGEVVSD
jgi:CheY-like chemotaxis protein